MKTKLNKGEVIYRSNQVSVCKWKDRRAVYTISNAHVPEMMDATNRHGKVKKKPNLVREYHQNMSLSTP